LSAPTCHPDRTAYARSGDDILCKSCYISRHYRHDHRNYGDRAKARKVYYRKRRLLSEILEQSYEATRVVEVFQDDSCLAKMSAAMQRQDENMQQLWKLLSDSQKSVLKKNNS